MATLLMTNPKYTGPERRMVGRCLDLIIRINYKTRSQDWRIGKIRRVLKVLQRHAFKAGAQRANDLPELYARLDAVNGRAGVDVVPTKSSDCEICR